MTHENLTNITNNVQHFIAPAFFQHFLDEIGVINKLQKQFEKDNHYIPVLINDIIIPNDTSKLKQIKQTPDTIHANFIESIDKYTTTAAYIMKMEPFWQEILQYYYHSNKIMFLYGEDLSNFETLKKWIENPDQFHEIIAHEVFELYDIAIDLQNAIIESPHHDFKPEYFIESFLKQTAMADDDIPIRMEFMFVERYHLPLGLASTDPNNMQQTYITDDCEKNFKEFLGKPIHREELIRLAQQGKTSSIFPRLTILPERLETTEQKERILPALFDYFAKNNGQIPRDGLMIPPNGHDTGKQPHNGPASDTISLSARHQTPISPG